MTYRLEQYKDRETGQPEMVYIAVDPDGVWARSEFPSELVTFDYNAQGRLIGIEVIGSAANGLSHSLAEALAGSLPESKADVAIREALAV
jgi:hypothetical protein